METVPTFCTSPLFLFASRKNILHVHKFNTSLVLGCLRVPEMMLVKSHLDFRCLLKVTIIMM